MYVAVVVGLMIALPILSILAELVGQPDSEIIWPIGKWFVFWAVGARLFTAGLRQMLQPSYTAKQIFGVTDSAAFTVVSELGVSNVAIGAIALASLAFPLWVIPAAAYALIFYGIAAVRHLRNTHKNTMETIATYSDLWVAVVLAIFLAGNGLA